MADEPTIDAEVVQALRGLNSIFNGEDDSCGLPDCFDGLAAYEPVEVTLNAGIIRALRDALRHAEARPRSLLDVMLDLYASEINSGMQSFWDGPFTVWLGGEMGRREVEGLFLEDELEEAAAWLREEALARYPNSKYAKEQARASQ